MSKSKIPYTNRGWNWALGCDPVSPGCNNCYAIYDVHRQSAPTARTPIAGQLLTINTGDGPKWTGNVAIVDERLKQPRHWAQPSKVFVNLLGDTFHIKVPAEVIEAAWHVMEECPQHWFQVLTKRPVRAASIMSDPDLNFPTLPNVSLGTSVESPQQYRRIAAILDNTNVSSRWLSMEPLLEACPDIPGLAELDWVVIGGESSKRKGDAAPMRIAWSNDIIKQCEAAGVPVFFKQTGAVIAQQYGLTHPAGADPAEWGLPISQGQMLCPQQFPPNPTSS